MTICIANYTTYLGSYLKSEDLVRLRGSLFNPSAHDDLSILTKSSWERVYLSATGSRSSGSKPNASTGRGAGSTDAFRLLGRRRRSVLRLPHSHAGNHRRSAYGNLTT